MSRPPLSTRQTGTTVLSSTTYSVSSSDRNSDSTALTTPDLHSPRKGLAAARLEPMLEVFESTDNGGAPSQSVPRKRSTELGRGPSVKDRASVFEQQAQASSSSSSSSSRRPLPTPTPLARTRSTSPLRINRRTAPVTPSNVKRVPVPVTAPPGRTAHLYEEPAQVSPTARGKVAEGPMPTSLTRGTGSAKRMIERWENGPSDPDAVAAAGVGGRRGPTQALRQPTRVMSREYLDQKPLPVPMASSIPSGSTHQFSPSRPLTSRITTPHRPSPLQHLQTPTPNRKRAGSLTPSPSSYSLSPSPGEKRRKGGRSPLKDMLNMFGGGIKDLGRKVKGKDKDPYAGMSGGLSPIKLDFESGSERLGSSGLPGGIVFSDRMGDQEMSTAGPDDPNVIRSSPVVYLIPTPCSSVAQWGSWLTSYASLNPSQLKITYCPVFQGPSSGNSTPRRVLSGASPFQASPPAVPFSSIPPPQAGTEPDVQLDMKDCVEVRSLRREEVKGRGVPPAPEGIGTEVLEMVWSDGSKRYIGVEGVAGRLGWVSAIWDVLLACKTQQHPPALPPPSPVPRENRLSQHSGTAPGFASFVPPSADAFGPTRGQIESPDRPLPLGIRSPPPVQKIGDTWVAASALGGSEAGIEGRQDNTTELRDSVQRLFDTAASSAEVEMGPEALVAGSPQHEPGTAERIKAWQPDTEHDLSIFRASSSSSKRLPPSEVGMRIPKTESVLSFDPADLNPSRSASQVRRNPTIKQDNDTHTHEPFRRWGRVLSPVMDERERDVDEMTTATALRAPTHISHVTFPKPTVGGFRMGALPPIAASTESCESDSSASAILQTPRTAETVLTSVSGESTVLAKLDSHSTEHDVLSKQMVGVQGDLRTVLTSLSTLVTQARSPSMSQGVTTDKFDTLQLDLKALENAISLSSLAVPRLAPEEPKLPEIHAKLDSIAKLCEDLLAQGTAAPKGAAVAVVATGRDANKSPIMPGGPMGAKSEEEKSAGEEVAQIMADLTGASVNSAGKVGGIQVLHNAADPEKTSEDSPTANATALPESSAKQVTEVLALVKELKDARALQSQQTTDIARYLHELNGWLDKFVQNSTSELSTIGTRLDTLVGTEASEAKEGTGTGTEATPGLPQLMADVHAMVSEQKRRNEAEGMVGQRLDGLLKMMGEDRERSGGQQALVEQVMGLLERQRQQNEYLLRELAKDLTAEIRGEKMRFVEAMQHATSVNVNFHVEEFKKVLAAEVNRSMTELGRMREEKKALEQNISDLFALKAKHGMERGSSRRNHPQLQAHGAASPQPQARGLPVAPHGRH